ncbi:MAG TPA: hypothetical protein VM925_05625 [Labilithrix sp.]|nr:hypothetical protein [Labilithrix sp.]
MVEETRDEDVMLEIATVPPPAGELDAYSAVTRLESTPLHLMAASMFADDDATDSVSSTDDDVLLAIETLEHVAPSIEPRSDVSSSSASPPIAPAPRDVLSMKVGDRVVTLADLAMLVAFAVLAVVSFFFV